jgi:hypothetical protein
MAGFATAVGVAAASGGYFPASWGVTTLALLVVAAAVIAFGGQTPLSRADLLFVGLFAGVLGWTAFSAVWSQSVPRTVLEVERSLVYVAAALAFVLVARREAVGRLLGGTLAGITAVAGYAIATRLAPERFAAPDALAGDRLAAPIGYWNGLGIYCVIGAVLAIGLAARRADRRGRAAAAATLPILATTIFFTFSRGGWVALAAGLAAMLVLGRERLRTVATIAAVAPAAGAAVLAASRHDALTHTGAAVDAASHAGQRFAPVLCLLTLGAGLSLLGLAALQRRVRLRSRTRRTIGIALVVFALAAGAGVIAATPWSTAKPPMQGNLNGRIVSVSTNGRTTLWRSAWQDAQAHPLLGSGAGTYELWFDAHRDTASLTVRDGHSLYLETLAELGPVGLVLLGLVLALPLAAAVRARGDGLALAAAGGYVAYLAHAGWDWDWELPAVTLAALVCAASLLGRARAPEVRPLSRRTRIVLTAALVLPAAFAATALAGNRATTSARQAAADGRWTQAAAGAHRAVRLAPWSPEPWQVLAQARLADGDFPGAAGALRHALRLDPRNWQLWLDLSIATEGAEHTAALDRARSLNPLYPDFPTT